MKEKRLFRLTWCMVAVSAVGLIGCGRKTGNVSGTVSIDGEALPAGRITFLCEGGDKPVLMSPINDGSYVINDAPVGPALVTVEIFEASTTAVPNMIESPLPPDQQNALAADAEHVSIPDRYRTPTTSELSHDIAAGSQVRDFHLTAD